MGDSMRKVIRAGALTIVLGLALGACGKDHEEAPYPGRSYPAKSLSEAQKSAAETRVFCDSSGGACNPSVGMLISATRDSVGACTAFVISENLMATNSHCIPADLKRRGASCEERIFIFFPDVAGFGSVKSECREILEASDLGDSEQTGIKRQDYAFIRLKDRAPRPAVALDYSGFDPAQVYELNKIDPYRSNGHFEGRLRRVQCKPVYKSNFLLSYDHPLHPLAAFGDCNVIQGNSGSPIFAVDGTVHGIIQATLQKEVTEQHYKARGIVLTEPLADMGIGTSFACLSDPTWAWRPIPGDCARQSEGDAITGDSKALNDEVIRIVESQSWSGKEVFAWDGLKVPDYAILEVLRKLTPAVVGRITFAPRCFRPTEGWIDSRKSGIFKRPIKAERLSTSLPVIELRLGMDAYQRFRLVPSLSTSLYSEIVFSPRELVKEGRSLVELKLPDLTTMTTRTELSKTLSVCDDSQ